MDQPRPLADRPAPPVLPLLLHTVWNDCRGAAAGLFSVHLATGLLPAVQVVFTARLLTAVLLVRRAGVSGFGQAVPSAVGLIAATILRSVLVFASGTI